MTVLGVLLVFAVLAPGEREGLALEGHACRSVQVGRLVVHACRP